MYAYIKLSGRLKRFRNIGLSNHFVPYVDDVSLEGTDPGLWFKCLLIDSLFIDCDERNVYWAKNSSSSDLLFHSTRECELKADEMLVFYRSKGSCKYKKLSLSLSLSLLPKLTLNDNDDRSWFIPILYVLMNEKRAINCNNV